MQDSLDKIILEVEDGTKAPSGNIKTFVDTLTKLGDKTKFTVTGLTDLKNKFDSLGVSLKGSNLRDAMLKFNENNIKFKTSGGDVVTVIKKMKDETDKYTVSVKKASTETSKSTGIFGSFTKGISGALLKFGIIKSALTGLSNKTVDITRQATEYEEALNLFTVTMGSKAQEASQWVEKFSKALYIDDSGLMQYMGSLNSLIKGLGVATDKSYIMSKNLTQLVYDLASFKNLDIETSFRKIQSAMSGEIEPLRNVGVALSQNTLQELANSMGIEQRVATMNEATKAQLRYIQILQSTTEWQGDMGRTLISPANAIRVLQQQFALLGRAIGRMFIPFVMKAIPYVMALTQILTDLANKIAAFFGYKIADIDYSSIKDMTVDISDGIEDIGDAATGTAKKLQTMLAPFDELNVVQRENEKAGKSGGVGGLGAGLDLPLPEYDALSGLTDQLSKNVDKAKKNLESFFDIAKKLAIVLGTLWAIDKLVKFSDKLRLLFGLVPKGEKELTGLAKVVNSVVTNFKKGYKESGSLAGGLKNVWDNTSKLTKALLGSAGLIIGLGLSYDAMYKLGKGTSDTTTSLLKFGGGIASAAAGGAAIGSIFGPAGTALGAFGGAVVSIVTGLTGLNNAMRKAEEERLAEKVFGTLHLNAEQFGQALQRYDSDFQAYIENLSNASSKVDSLKQSYINNEEALDSYTYKVGVLGQTIGDEYESNMKPKLESMFNDARTIVDTSAEAMKTSLINGFRDGTDLSVEEQTRLLSNIDENSTWAKNKIDSAEARINEIYTNASRERRSLNADELEEIKKLLNQIDALTVKEVTESETKYYNLKRKFKDKRYQLDISSYDEFAKALTDYQTSKEKELDTAYAQEMKLAEYWAGVEYEKILEQYGDEEKAQEEHNRVLLEKQNLADQHRAEGQKKLEADIQESKDNILADITTMWSDLYSKSDPESIKQRQLIEKIFEKIDPQKLQGLKEQMETEGKQDGEALRNSIITGFGKEKFSLDADADVKLDVKLSTARINTKDFEKAIQLEVNKVKFPSITPNFSTTYSTTLRAGGGFPKTGEFFMAREAGPEMVGRIGNKTAVANNDQITTSITNALVIALSGMNLGGGQGTTVVNISGRKVFEGVGDYVDSENDRYGTNYVNV